MIDTTQTAAPIIQAEKLVKCFGETEVVSAIDINVSKGQCFGILGPNGAGKTTTIRMTLGQSPISDGQLNVFGLQQPQDAAEIRYRCGVVPQQDNLDPDFTVSENLKIYARYFGLESAQIERRIKQLLDFVELTDKANTRIESLSGGMKRRLSIARALINNPELLILDEPTTGLDPQVRHMIWARLRQLKKYGKTILLTTHYLEEAERLCDMLVIMDQGRIIAQGSPKQLILEYVEPHVFEIRARIKSLSEQLKSLANTSMEIIGDSTYVYTAEQNAIITLLQSKPELEYYHRPGNLEDVFLKLTGRELRD